MVRPPRCVGMGTSHSVRFGELISLSGGSAMAQDFSRFVTIAEIAGVFVGFGALISVTRRDQIEVADLARLRAVVTIGLVVVVAALVPIGLGRYGLTGHVLWLTSSLIFLALIWAVIILSIRRPEHRRLTVAQARSSPAAASFFWILLELPIQASLILAILGPYPDLEPAFYTTALILHLAEAAFVLAQLVYSQRVDRPAP